MPSCHECSYHRILRCTLQSPAASQPASSPQQLSQPTYSSPTQPPSYQAPPSYSPVAIKQAAQYSAGSNGFSMKAEPVVSSSSWTAAPPAAGKAAAIDAPAPRSWTPSKLRSCEFEHQLLTKGLNYRSRAVQTVAHVLLCSRPWCKQSSACC